MTDNPLDKAALARYRLRPARISEAYYKARPRMVERLGRQRPVLVMRRGLILYIVLSNAVGCELASVTESVTQRIHNARRIHATASLLANLLCDERRWLKGN